MLPIVFEEAVEFLGTELFKGQMPYVITHDDSEGLPNILWESNDMRLKVFGKKTITKYNVHSFFFQLAASGIISLLVRSKYAIPYLKGTNKMQ